MTRFDHYLGRRGFLQLATASCVSGWVAPVAHAAATDPARKRSCIVLWMNGGPSTIDMWDLKPGHANGGPYKEIATNAPGLRIGEHLPRLAKWGDRLAVLRGMSTKEGDHGRATYQLRTGTLPQGAIDFPTFGSVAAKEMRTPGAALPPYVSIAPQRFLAQTAFGPGFLGPEFAPLIVADGQTAGDADQALKVENLSPQSGVKGGRAAERLVLLNDLEANFLGTRPGPTADGHRAAYAAAVKLMDPATAKAFDLTGEKKETRDAYGRSLFGQGCLLARRLVERGVPFVEVTLSSAAQASWDSHANNFDMVKSMCGVLDTAWAALMGDLKDRGLLDTTTIVCTGEFGRTPKINAQKGRDHWPDAWSAVIAGGGIKGGQAVGKTGKDGMKVEDRPTTVPDLLATICKAIGVDTEKQNMSNVGRPIRIVEKTANPVTEVLL